MNQTKWKEQIIKSIKISVAAILAIAIAKLVGLQYETTAGIVTILSIQNTKLETLATARNRALAFVCALVISLGCFALFDFTLVAFGIYLLLFALVCMHASWMEALAMDSVLITHLLTEKSYGLYSLGNEVGLFIIGTGMGIIINLHLHKKGNEFDELAEVVDTRMKGILQSMQLMLLNPEYEDVLEEGFWRLELAVNQAKECAVRNLNNSFLAREITELSYVEMREQQSDVLRGIYAHIKDISYLPQQGKTIASLVREIEQGYHKENTVEQLLEKLEEFYQELRKQPLPTTREEFEVRAILYYVLIELKKLLELKREFIVNRDNEWK